MLPARGSCLASRRDTKTGDAPRHWRWRGFLTDYYTAELREGAVVIALSVADGHGSKSAVSQCMLMGHAVPCAVPSLRVLPLTVS